MGLIDYYYNLSVCTILDIVIPVLDDLIVYVLEYEEHLGIGNSIVLISQQ